MKTIKAITLFIICGFILQSLEMKAQTATVENSIKIQNNKFSDKEEYYTAAIYESNLESYRLRDKDVTLTFSEGFECVLFSATALANKGIKIDVNSYQTEFDSKFILPTFSITEDRKLIATYKKISK